MVIRKLHLESNQSQFKALARVAFATADRVHVDQHFGQTNSLVIYELNKQHYQLLDVIDFGEEQQRGHRFLSDKIAMLAQCDAVYCNACGVSALRQLLAQDTYPIKVEQGTKIKQCLLDLQHQIVAGTVRWIKSRKGRGLDNNPLSAELSSLLDEPWN